MEKFDGSGDFGMWKYKMLMQLKLQGLENVLNEDLIKDTKEEEDSSSKAPVEAKKDPMAKEKDTRARSLICSSLTNIVLRKVMKETITLGVWKALEGDYQTKSLPYRIYLKQRFASYKMVESKTIEENLDIPEAG